MPPGYPTESPSPIRGEGQGLGRLAAAGPTRGSERPEGEISPRSILSPNKKTQKEERDSVIDAVQQITGAKKETPVWEGPVWEVLPNTIGIPDMMESLAFQAI